MSTKRDRIRLKTYFETGDRPTEGEFIEFIDSIIVQNADHIWVDADSDAKNVGIGTESPQKKLHVNGNTQLDGDTHVKGLITVGGDIYGDKSTKDGDKDLLIVRNGGEIQFFGKRYPGRQGDLFLIGDKSDNGSGKIVFSQLLGPGAWRNNMAIDTHGNVGIGTENPQDALQIGTGLAKLDFGSAYGENTGWGGGYIGFNTARNNGSWTTETDLGNNGAAVIYSDVSGGLNFATLATDNPSAGGQTRSDQELRNNIKLKIRNNGNVGIGVNNPTEKIEVSGNAKFKTNLGEFLVSNHNNGESVSVVQRRTDHLNLGNIRYDQAWGNGSSENVCAYIHTYKESNGLYVGMGSKTTDLYFGAGLNSTLKIVTNNDGVQIGAELNNNRDWFFHGNNIYLGASWDSNNDQNGLVYNNSLKGPQLFGDQGGMLGVKNASGFTPALEWKNDKTVDFKGEIKVNGRKPFKVKRFTGLNKNELPRENVGGLWGVSTGISTTDYAAAVIVGFKTSEALLQDAFSGFAKITMYCYMRNVNNTWCIVADISSLSGGDETWTIDVMFIQSELIDISGFY